MELNSTNRPVEFTSTICLKPAAPAAASPTAYCRLYGCRFDRQIPGAIRRLAFLSSFLYAVIMQTGCFGNCFNDCINRFSCTCRNLCSDPDCRNTFCKNCIRCRKFCDSYEKQICKKLLSPPYVCNGCSKRGSCTLEKRLYSASAAQKEYEAVRSESRTGICISESEAAALDALISPLVKQGQSVHHICVNNASDIMHSEKTIYNYMDCGIFSAKNLDLPRKVRYRPRKKENPFKVDKTCRIGRTFDDFLEYLKENPDCPVVQMDSLEGVKGGRVLLTVHFVKAEFMLAFIRDRNTATSVHSIIEKIYEILTPEVFSELFPVMLTDNGSEFSDPVSIETDSDGLARTRIFYCEASSPYQKGAIENNHEFIRRIIPKGTSLDNFTQKDIGLMMNHINSYTRANLGDKSPYEMFSIIYGEDILKKMGAEHISANDIVLLSSLLK